MDKKKILVVDDEPDVTDLVAYHLKAKGFHVETLTDATASIGQARSFQPNLIILDIMMPKIDGIETCYKLRALEDLPKNVVIAFLTARGEDYTQVAALESGADDFIIKPIKQAIILAKDNVHIKAIKDTNNKSK